MCSSSAEGQSYRGAVLGRIWINETPCYMDWACLSSFTLPPLSLRNSLTPVADVPTLAVIFPNCPKINSGKPSASIIRAVRPAPHPRRRRHIAMASNISATRQLVHETSCFVGRSLHKMTVGRANARCLTLGECDLGRCRKGSGQPWRVYVCRLQPAEVKALIRGRVVRRSRALAPLVLEVLKLPGQS